MDILPLLSIRAKVRLEVDIIMPLLLRRYYRRLDFLPARELLLLLQHLRPRSLLVGCTGTICLEEEVEGGRRRVVSRSSQRGR